MTGNHLFDTKQMFRHACAFASCAEFCRKDGHTIDHVKPEIVNSAFACEVFLKSLLFYNKIEYGKKHDLEALYGLLPAQHKGYIECELLKQYGKLHNAFGISYLSNVSKAFEVWRYSFEKRSLQIEIGFLLTFRDLLRELCCMEYYKMTWDEYKESKYGEIG